MKTTQRNALIKVWPLASLGVACILVGGAGQQNQTAPDVGSRSVPLIRSVEGPELSRAYCASCRGLNGKGGGPAAATLDAKVPDLTILAMNDDGEFPTQHVREVSLRDLAETKLYVKGQRHLQAASDIVQCNRGRPFPLCRPV